MLPEGERYKLKGYLVNTKKKRTPTMVESRLTAELGLELFDAPAHEPHPGALEHLDRRVEEEQSAAQQTREGVQRVRGAREAGLSPAPANTYEHKINYHYSIIRLSGLIKF